MIEYIAEALEWYDKTYGNPYSSVRVISTQTGKVVKVYPFQYGRADNYRLLFMRDNGLDYSQVKLCSSAAKKREAEAWGKLDI